MIDLHRLVDELISQDISVEFLKEGQTYSLNSTPIAKLMLCLLGSVAEHFGFIHLLSGIYGHLRNDHAHRARLRSEEKEQDFLDPMAMISYAHRVIDRS
ncbi:TIGR02391 family protein [Corynebacterium glutamicum]|uniref:TIGR02391 family protein n=1 Tax=Corynebacterium glutamicum TaxID=1718 RepID=UPI0020B1559B|nr:TIGR02391 family protein [Corynebacterium glutamicum]